MPGLPLESRTGEKRLESDEKEAENYLKSLADRIQSEEKLTVSYDVQIGVAGPTIVEYCEKNAVELIAIATHGRSGPGRVILGSVADYVIRHSGKPILLVRPANL
jgi:nucleotide-binding universal stress UspA family protein